MRVNIGAIIVSMFAIVWTAAGAATLRQPWRALLVVGSILISGAIIYLSSTVVPKHPVQFHATAYNVAVVLELVAIFAAVVYLKRTGRKPLIFPVISIIVGLHFFGMVPALGSSEYWWIGAAMCLLPIVTLSMLPRTLWQQVVGLGCAGILWLSVLWAMAY